MDPNEVNTKEMAKTMMQIERTSDDCVNTVHITDLPYAEISKSFALRWKDQLDETWHLIDAQGNHHIVKYNKYLKDPLIQAGWQTIREYYHLEHNCQITLTHYGQSVFLITVFKTPSQPHAFPKWHSLYKQNPDSIIFRVMLNEHKISASALDAPSTMYYFLQDSGFTQICFNGTTPCKLVFNHWRKSLKIGAGWKAFARDNDLKANCEFIMKFPYPTSNIVHWFMC